MALVYAPTSVFVRPVSAVIVRSQPGRLRQVSQTIAQRELTRGLSLGPLGLVKPWLGAALSAARQIPAFDMHAAVLDAISITQLAQDPDVAAIYEDRLVGISQFPPAPQQGTYTLGIPTQTGRYVAKLNFTSTEWVRSLVGADRANAAGFDGSGVLACVVDTGGKRHPQTLRARAQSVIPGNYVDFIGHGQWCLSALGGTRYYDSTFSAAVGTPVYCEGMAPGAALLAVKALDFVTGSAPTSMLLLGLQAALASKADVVSLSWGGPAQTSTPEGDPFYPAIEALDAAGAIVCAAAGNAGPGYGTLDSPGALPQPVTVGAYNAVANDFNPMFGAAGEAAAFSSRGPPPWGGVKPDCVAPGAIIDSGVSPVSEMAVSYTYRPHGAQAIAGTSMATPIVAGLCALMRQAHAKLLGRVLTNAEVKAMLAATAESQNDTGGWGAIGWDRYVQYMSTQYGVAVPGG